MSGHDTTTRHYCCDQCAFGLVGPSIPWAAAATAHRRETGHSVPSRPIGDCRQEWPADQREMFMHPD